MIASDFQRRQCQADWNEFDDHYDEASDKLTKGLEILYDEPDRARDYLKRAEEIAHHNPGYIDDLYENCRRYIKKSEVQKSMRAMKKVGRDAKCWQEVVYLTKSYKSVEKTQKKWELESTIENIDEFLEGSCSSSDPRKYAQQLKTNLQEMLDKITQQQEKLNRDRKVKDCLTRWETSIKKSTECAELLEKGGNLAEEMDKNNPNTMVSYYLTSAKTCADSNNHFEEIYSECSEYINITEEQVKELTAAMKGLGGAADLLANVIEAEKLYDKAVDAYAKYFIMVKRGNATPDAKANTISSLKTALEKITRLKASPFIRTDQEIMEITKEEDTLKSFLADLE